MNGSIGDYSTKKISKTLVEEVISSLKSVDSYGSIEIIVQDNFVTQITVRNIKKTKNAPSNGKSKTSNNSKSIVNRV